MTYSYKQFCSLLVCLTFACSTFGETIYVNVNASGGDNGTSWSNAYLSLGNALQNASSGDQIWVASGIYYPSLTNNRNASFVLPNNVAILGGFPNSGSPTISGRNPTLNITILSGDIDQNGTLANNAYTIIYSKDVSSSTILDGFTITGGNANGTFTVDFPILLVNGGAAWVNEASNFNNSNPTVRNCIFEGNHAVNRGGAIFQKAAPGGEANYTLENCLFQNNFAGKEGGAIFNAQSGSGSICAPTVTNTNFISNTAGESGGAVYNNGAFFGEVSGSYLNCTFNNNTSNTHEGGAVYNNAFFLGNSNPNFTDCNFTNNSSIVGSGGAIYTDASSDGESNFKITNCVFDNNSSVVYGGAICSIISNGGIIKPTYSNSVFSQNSSANGGATYSRGAFGSDLDVFIVNCVFFKNSGGIGGVIYQNESGINSLVHTKVSNSIFEENTAGFSPTFHLTGPSSITLNHSIFDVSNCNELVHGDGFSEADCNGGNLFNQDPLFTNPNGGDFHVFSNSPAINAGNNPDVPAFLTTDSDGNPRIADGNVDIGVYEQVSTNSDNDNDGILDINDNCPITFNPDQTDIDGDGTGTVCDCDDSILTGNSCNTGCSNFYVDSDGDGFGNPATFVTTCVALTGYVANNQDFNDGDATLYPNAPELCDGKDNNNNGQIDEGTDDDNDGVCNEDDICPGGDDTIDLNNNNIPDDCESQISINCPADITVSADAGQSTTNVTWVGPTGSTDCNGGGSSGGSCSGTTISGFSFKGEFEGSDYYMSDNSTIWTVAQANAAANGGHLVVINSANENAFVKGIIGNNIVHIGITDEQSEGTFEWVNGDALNYTNFEGIPSSQDYGIMLFWNGKWSVDGDYGKFYLMEIPCGGSSGGLAINQTAGPANGAQFPIGTTQVEFTATDDCEGSKTCSFNVTVNSTTSNLSITCPSNITVIADPGATSKVVNWTEPSSSTTCTVGTINVTASTPIGASFSIGSTTVTYTATDGCGNTETCSFDVTVNEGTSIVNLNCPANIIMDANSGATSKIISYNLPIGSTTCATGNVTVTLESGLASGAAFPIGTTIVEYTGTDECSSTDVCSFSVTVNAVGSNLTLNCPSNITESVNSAIETVAVTWNNPTGGSDCGTGGYAFTQTAGPNKGSQFGVGSTTIEYTASDNCGNNIICNFSVTVNVSSNNLSLTCPSDVNISVPQGAGGGLASWTMPAATTDCTTGGGGSCTGSLISGFDYIGEFNGSDYYISQSKAPWLTAKSNCELAGGTLVGIEDNAENQFINGVVGGEIIHIGLTDMDSEGNPVWLNGEPTIFNNFSNFNANNEGNDFTVFYHWDGSWDWTNNSAWRYYMLEIKCGGPSNSIPQITQTAGLSSGSTFPTGTTTISYEATDDCGNLSTCSFTVNVTETTVTCDPDTDGGQISGNELICDPYDPQTINSTVFPTGGSGAIEYMWLKSETGCPTNINQAISNTNNPTYNPPFITTTTHYLRWSRRANCSNWVASNCITKTVDDCGPTTNYCDLSAEQPWQEWISKVELADLSNPSGKSLGYKDFTNLVANLTAGGTYSLTIELSFSYNQWDENVYVWMDFNQDKDFNDPGELIIETLSPSNGNGGTNPHVLAQSFTVPATALAGNTRMRVAMKREAGSNPCDVSNDGFIHGEVEDYTLNITPSAANRAKPVLAFEAYSSIGQSVLEWFSNTTDLENNFEIERSTDNQYFHKIEEVVVIYNTGFESYYKIIDEYPVFGNNYYRIKQIFKDGKTTYTDVEKLVYGQENTRLHFYPNPAKEFLYVDLRGFLGQDGIIQIINIIGQVMKEQKLENIQSSIHELDLNRLENGMHTLIFSTKGKHILTEMFVIDKGF